nr:MAG TPA: Protein of unknown function (DUF551) [Caudoviricetes sp.]
MTRKEQEDQEQLEWMRKWKERRKGKRDVRKKSLFYKALRRLGIIKDYEEDIRIKMEMCERARKANVCPEDCDICAWSTKGGVDYNGYITTGRNNRKPSEVSAKNQSWIPCSERFPDGDRYILVSFENSTMPDIARYEENDEGGTFYPGDDEKSYSSYGFFVDAWMPLPEPYREGE